jgi:putative membrane protein
MIKKYFPHALLTIYIIEFIIAGINPYSRAVWYVENGPIVLLVAFITFLYWRGVRFSNTAYALMFVLPFLHTIGGHYTFERVPFDWFDNLFGFERNMFDRVAHFTVGFYALPLIEYLESRKLVAKRWIAVTYSIFAITFVAVFYEWIEWWYAASEGGSAGAAFLGSQGDIWDAQKDMLMDVLGAVFAALLYMASKFRQISRV